MTIESLVNAYGYLAVLIGTSFEGETILVLFGSVLEILIDNIKHYELEILVAIAATGGLIWTIYLHHRRRHQGADQGISRKGKCHLNLEARGRFWH